MLTLVCPTRPRRTGFIQLELPELCYLSYRGYRFRAEIIFHYVWLYFLNGQLVYLWRAADQEGELLDILVQSRCNAGAAKRFFKKLLKASRYSPRKIVTDKLPSYTSAHRELISEVEHLRGGRSYARKLCMT